MDKDFKLISKNVKPKTALLYIFSLFKPFLGTIILVIIFSLLSTLASVLIPQTLQIAIDTNIPQKDIQGLTNTSLIFIGLVLVFFFTSIIQTNLSGGISQKALYSLRRNLFGKLQELPIAFFNQNKIGEIEIRISSNVENINRFFSEGVIRIVNIGASLIGFLIMMWLLNPTLTSIIIISLIIFILFLNYQGKFLRTKQKKALDIEGDFSSFIQEVLNGFPIIKIFNKQESFKEIFHKKNNSLFRENLKVVALSSINDGFLPLLQILSGSLILYFGLNQLNEGVLTSGQFVAFFSYLVLFFRRFEGIGNLWISIQSGIAAAQRILELFQLKTNINVEAEKPITQEVKGEIEFQNVYFSYEDNVTVLKDINLFVPAGKTIAIVGPTGGGKTSFVSLIARLYDPNKGTIKMDGIDLKEWDLKHLRETIGYLLQESFFFEDTIFNNLRYDSTSKLTKEDVTKYFNQFSVESFFSNLSSGIDTVIKPDTLSQGQRQILALIRLIIRNPRILILDEATANIDTKTEKILIDVLDKVKKGKTTFVIAHRLSTIFNADEILLIQNNSIIEKGTHQELLDKKGKYFEIYSKFASK